MASTFRLKRKTFSGINDVTNMVPMSEIWAQKKKGESGKVAVDRVLGDTQKKSADKAAKRAAERAKNIANPGAAGAKAGFARGQKSVGVMGGLKNTWKSGAKGKAGILAGVAALTYTGAKAFGGKKKKEGSY